TQTILPLFWNQSRLCRHRLFWSVFGLVGASACMVAHRCFNRFMTWLLQQPAALVGLLTVLITVGLAVLGLLVARRLFDQHRLESAAHAGEQVFNLAGVLYAVLVAFVVVVVWEQFDQAKDDTESEAVAISDLLRDSEGLPAAARPATQASLIAYTKD